MQRTGSLALSLLCAACALAVTANAAAAIEAAGPATLSSVVEGLETREGLFDLHLDHLDGKVWLELPARISEPEGVEFLYADGLRTGLGSNPVGLDRGFLGPARLVRFRRVGGRIFLEEINTRYRALSDNADERQAVRDSFATSILWSAPIGALDPDGRLLVDLTSFLVRDARGSARILKQTGQGSFSLDPDRSAVDLRAVLAFPDNLEIDAILTFKGEEPGSHVRQTTPSPHEVTLTQHHSLIRLPAPGYTPRRFDPRAPSFAIGFMDYAAPLDGPIRKQWIVRHRLEKTNPEAKRSKVKAPIVYYVDRGAPEPIRSALVEGASWWAAAFKEAGFEEAFRVETQPEGVHPMDVRYNMIQWVHRSTRGWSFGGGLIDPRTGEMLKAHVRLGSLRVRQDRRLFEGLAGTSKTGNGDADDPVELALARIRQLSAHEVGHTLGFSHNFATSTYGRASVMDYPAPLVTVNGSGELDFSRAYAVGAGAWDVHGVRYAYSQFPAGADEEEELERIIREGFDKGYLYLGDSDARPAGAAHPLANLWDNGPEPAGELERILRVRRIALNRFGEESIRPGRPLALLHETLIPLFFHHRYQLQAAVKVVGGLEYAYAVRGDGQPPARMIDAGRQREALRAVLLLLNPEHLDLPEKTLALLLPRPDGFPPNRELHRGGTDPTFDALGLAGTAAREVVRNLLQKERAARLVDQHRRDESLPGMEEILQSLERAVFDGPLPANARRAEIVAITRAAVVEGMLDLSANERVTPGVRARVDDALRALQSRLDRSVDRDDPRAVYDRMLAGQIRRYLERRVRDLPGRPGTPEMPPGSPIGSGGFDPLAEGGCSLAEEPLR